MTAWSMPSLAGTVSHRMHTCSAASSILHVLLVNFWTAHSLLFHPRFYTPRGAGSWSILWSNVTPLTPDTTRVFTHSVVKTPMPPLVRAMSRVLLPRWVPHLLINEVSASGLCCMTSVGVLGLHHEQRMYSMLVCSWSSQAGLSNGYHEHRRCA